LTNTDKSILDSSSPAIIMKLSLALALLLSIEGAAAFSPVQPSSSRTTRTLLASSATTEEAAQKDASATTKDPLLIRAARGEKTERTPVWMMRQAGRHIAEYRDLCKEYPTFRQRSEIPDVAVEVSLQPWRNYQTDGCILFSDILTPFPGMGVDFQIDEKLGPVMEPMRNWDDIKKVRPCVFVLL
jgi:uroporphyrinogen decarboxylase